MRRFSKWFVASFSLVLAIGPAPYVLAQNQPAPGNERRGASNALPGYDAIMKLPSLTAEQRLQIDALANQTRQNMSALFQQVGSLRQKMAGGTLSPEDQQLAQGLKDQRIQLLQGWSQKANAILTPEQRAELPSPGGARQPMQRQRGPEPGFVPFDTSHLVPITELGHAKYQGFEGGLYPHGTNVRPASHEAAGLALAHEVVPLDKNGKPSNDGKIVLISIGFSNSTMEFSTFKSIADADASKNAKLLIVDCAQGGMDAQRIHDPNDNKTGTRFWGIVDQRLSAAGADPQQVQAAWVKEINARPEEPFLQYTKTLESQLAEIMVLLKKKFPNLKLVYLSSRSFGGYSQDRGSPEPYAYETAFAVKWLIEEQLNGNPELNYDPKKGAVNAPWLSWGPYFWANGTHKNEDGLFYVRADYREDGKHPSGSGLTKIADQMLQFFKTDSTTKPWFVKN